MTPAAPSNDRKSPWPIAIAIALIVVMAINAAFIWIAVDGQDPVVPSYVTEAR